MSEENIEIFMQVTQSNRRTACYFLTENHNDVNLAVGNFYEHGLESIPDAYEEFPSQPPRDTSDQQHEGSMPPSLVASSSHPEEEDHSPFDYSAPQPIPTTETSNPNLSSFGNFMQRLFEENSQNESPESENITQIESANLPPISDSSQFQKLIPSDLGRILNRHISETPKNAKQRTASLSPLPLRKSEESRVCFILWSNGYSIDDQFTSLSGEPLASVVSQLSAGRIPIKINCSNFQFVDRRSELFSEKSIQSALHPRFVLNKPQN